MPVVAKDVAVDRGIRRHKQRSVQIIRELSVRCIAAHAGDREALLRAALLPVRAEEQIVYTVDTVTFRRPVAVLAPCIVLCAVDPLRSRPGVQIVGYPYIERAELSAGRIHIVAIPRAQYVGIRRRKHLSHPVHLPFFGGISIYPLCSRVNFFLFSRKPEKDDQHCSAASVSLLPAVSDQLRP